MAKPKRATKIPENIPATPFAAWRDAMGFNGKQVAEAGASVGLGNQVAGAMNRGSRKLSHLELLGLTAALAGLPPFTADLTARLDERARTMLRLAGEDVSRCLKARGKERS
jgi:hypothetical protein